MEGCPSEVAPEDARAREIQRLDAQVEALQREIWAHDGRMPAPPHVTPADLERFDRWKAERDALVEAAATTHRMLADRYLPLPASRPATPLVLFDGHWLPPFEDRYTGPVFVDSFFDHPGETGRFLRTFLLYDRLYLPTVSLLVVPLLLSIVGHERLLEVLASGDITLVRYRGVLGYGPNGEGVTLRRARTSLDGRPDLEGARPWAAAEEVLAEVGEQFSARHRLGRDGWSVVTRAVLGNIVEVEAGEIDAVVQATYHEVAGHDQIREQFGVHGARLRALPNVPDGQVRWLTGGWLGDGVDALLHLAQANVETYLAEKLGARDQSIGPGAEVVLGARLEQVLAGRPPDAAPAVRLLEFRGISEFAAAHGSDRLVEAIWRLRASREGRAFRHWFHAHVRETPEEAEAQAVEVLVKPTVGDGGGRRPLRFLTVPGGLGVTSDGLLLGRFLRPDGPKLMLDGSRGVLPDPVLARAHGYRANGARVTMRRRVR